jgi:hypothetical protein
VIRHQNRAATWRVRMLTTRRTILSLSEGENSPKSNLVLFAPEPHNEIPFLDLDHNLDLDHFSNLQRPRFMERAGVRAVVIAILMTLLRIETCVNFCRRKHDRFNSLPGGGEPETARRIQRSLANSMG